MNTCQISAIQTHKSELCETLGQTVELFLSRLQLTDIITSYERQLVENIKLDTEKVLKILDTLAHRNDGFPAILRFLEERNMLSLAEKIELAVFTHEREMGKKE